MIKKTLTLCTLATLTLFTQAHSNHLHEALKQINEQKITKQNSKPIEDLLKQCQQSTWEKQQNNKSNMKWGAGETIGGIIGLLFLCGATEETSIVNKIVFFSLILSVCDGTPRLIRSAIDHFKHNKEYTSDIEATEKALATIKAKKENTATSQSNIEEA